MEDNFLSNTIVSALSLTIGNYFKVIPENTTTPIYPKVYTERILQGAVEPFFFIWVVDVDVEKLMNNNYMHTYQMNIRYHPKKSIDSAGVTSNTYATLREVAMGLSIALTRLNLPISVAGEIQFKPIIGTQMSHNINEEILQFYVTYAVKTTLQLAQDPFMEELDLTSFYKQ